MRWQKKLTKKELQHMKEWCRGTIAGLKRNREAHHSYQATPPDGPEACWDCRMIAKKLGIEK